MFGSIKNSKNNLVYLENVEAWTRSRFSLSDHDVVLVSEVNSVIPGCPPVETVIAFWSDPETRYRFTIFKPVIDVCEKDLPVSWLKSSLRDDGDLGCC